MHELGITQTMIAIALEQAGGAKVRRIILEVGKLAAVLPEAMQFCFVACRNGTDLAGASLEIIEIPGLGRCRQCGTEIPLEYPFGVCPCGSTDLDVIQGEELRIKELEIEDRCV
jgi:hydrogenase nickel incorporation protein HypA/HybF